MLVTLLGMVIISIFTQPWKAASPIVLTEVGISIALNPHLRKAMSPMLSTPLGMFTSARLLQNINRLAGIDVSVLGSTALRKLSQPLNADSPRLTIEAGISILFKPVLQKAKTPISFKVEGSVTSSKPLKS
jgi:ribulose 1,5-bisphosphate carboxylase large subunit-like protein